MRETFYTIPGCPVLIALVSDLHERPFGPVLASLERRRPDLICVAGDFLYGYPVEGAKLDASGMLPFFEACAELAPCFVSLGNHEWVLLPEDIERISGTGVHVLDNAFVSCDTAGMRLVLGGQSSARYNACQRLYKAGYNVWSLDLYDRTAKATPVTDWLDAYCAAPGYRILLCHHPEYYPRYLRSLDIPLILSGHAHGGQVRIFGQGLFSPGQGLFPKLTSGVTDGRLIISRGLANRQKVPRLFNPTEIVYVRG